MTDTDTKVNPQLSLAEVHHDALRAANASWSETDKLYVSVCSALVALAAIFGRSASGSSVSMAFVGVLVLLLSTNWMLLIKRYRRKILAALEGLAIEYKGSKVGDYFDGEQRRFAGDRNDYSIAVVVLLLSLMMIFYPIVCRLCGIVCA